MKSVKYSGAKIYSNFRIIFVKINLINGIECFEINKS